MSSIAENVLRGARFLDERMPGWEDAIDLDALDLSTTCNCVVGQLHASRGVSREARYERGLDALGINDYRTPRMLGFETAGRQTYERLTDSWRRLIRRRRGG